MSKIPDKWWSSGVDPDQLSEEVIKTDKWDRADLARMEAEASELAAAGMALADFAPTGGPLMADTFHSLHKAAPRLKDPKEIKPTYLINHAVMGEAQELTEHRSARSYTRGDDVTAALLAASLEPDLETLLDREQLLQREAEKLNETMSALAAARDEKVDIDEMFERWTGQGQPGAEGEEGGESAEGEGQGSGGPSEDELQKMEARAKELQGEIDKLSEEAEAQGAAVTEQLQRDTPSIRAHLAQSFDRAVENTRQIASMTRAWGLEPGVMQRLPADERIELAKKLNTPRMRRIAELFGPMRNLAMAEQMRKVPEAMDEVVSVTLGQDLERMLPTELLKLGSDRDDEFYKDYAEGRIAQYEMAGKDKVAKGAIILCEDGSGSMSGEPERWAKAVMGCLLNIARKQKRAFHLIHFGSPGQTHTVSFEKPSDYTVDKILEAFEIFFASGTCFTTPINVAVDKIRHEYEATGHTDSDIVFVSDGLCGVSEQFKAWFREEQDRMGFTLWGIIIGMPKESEPLYSLADGKVCDVKDLTANGSEIRSIFSGV